MQLLLRALSCRNEIRQKLDRRVQFIRFYIVERANAEKDSMNGKVVKTRIQAHRDHRIFCAQYGNTNKGKV